MAFFFFFFFNIFFSKTWNMFYLEQICQQISGNFEKEKEKEKKEREKKKTAINEKSNKIDPPGDCHLYSLHDFKLALRD